MNTITFCSEKVSYLDPQRMERNEASKAEPSGSDLDERLTMCRQLRVTAKQVARAFVTGSRV